MVGFCRDGFAFLDGEVGEREDIGNRRIEDSEVAEEGFTVVAPAAADAIGHFMALGFDFLELGVVRLIHAEMETKCLVGIRHTRQLDGGIGIG